MSRVAAIGERALVSGFALAGAVVFAADDPDAVDATWDALPDDIGVVVLTRAASAHLGARVGERPYLLPVVMP